MELHRFLSLLAALIGFIGAVFLAKGTLALTPKAMLDLTTPHSRFDCAPEQIFSLATQKADTMVGVIYIGAAFVIQIISLLFANSGKFVTESRWVAFWIALAIVSLLTIIFSLANIRIRDWYRLEMGKLEVKAHCGHTFSRERIDPGSVKGIQPMAKDLLDLTREESESMADFLRRVANYVGYKIPDGVDLSTFTNK